MHKIRHQFGRVVGTVVVRKTKRLQLFQPPIFPRHRNRGEQLVHGGGFSIDFGPFDAVEHRRLNAGATGQFSLGQSRLPPPLDDVSRAIDARMYWPPGKSPPGNALGSGGSPLSSGLIASDDPRMNPWALLAG
jgi:hypothetical protein